MTAVARGISYGTDSCIISINSMLRTKRQQISLMHALPYPVQVDIVSKGKFLGAWEQLRFKVFNTYSK